MRWIFMSARLQLLPAPLAVSRRAQIILQVEHRASFAGQFSFGLGLRHAWLPAPDDQVKSHDADVEFGKQTSPAQDKLRGVFLAAELSGFPVVCIPGRGCVGEKTGDLNPFIKQMDL